MLDELTKFASGVVGNNIAQFTPIATITTPGRGRYKIWGTCRHSLVDGCKILVGSFTLVTVASGASSAQDFGPVVFDITNNTDSIIAQLGTATGAADTASATIYAQRLVSL